MNKFTIQCIDNEYSIEKLINIKYSVFKILFTCLFQIKHFFPAIDGYSCILRCITSCLKAMCVKVLLGIMLSVVDLNGVVIKTFCRIRSF